MTTTEDLDPRLRARHRRYRRPETVLRKALEFLGEPGRFTTREHVRVRPGGEGKAASWLRQTAYDLPPTACMCLDGAIRWFSADVHVERAAMALLEPHLDVGGAPDTRSRVYRTNDRKGKRGVLRLLRRALGEG